MICIFQGEKLLFIETSGKRSIIVCKNTNRKVPNAREHNVKEHCNSYFNRKKTKLVVIEHSKISNKLSKTIRKAENVSQVDLGKVSIALYILKQQ